MRILAIESSLFGGSVASLEENLPVAEITLPTGQRTAQTLAPSLRDLLQQSGWQPQEIDLVAVTVGPGSFTGLRIGVTTAKTLAYACGCEILGIETLDVLAHQVPVAAHALWVVMDAERDQLFAARFHADQGHWRPASPPEIVEKAMFLERLQPGEMITGTVMDQLQPSLPAGVRRSPPTAWLPRAVSVGQVAWRDYLAGRRSDVWQLRPTYLRDSAAEEKLKGPAC